jgi:carbamoyltransferase
MLIIGFSGGFDPVHPATNQTTDYRIVDTPYWYHDAAAVLLDGGRIVAAVEQERLDRIKHSNRFPGEAIERCLSLHGARVRDVDQFVYYSRESRTDLIVGRFMLKHPAVKPRWTARAVLQNAFYRHFGSDLPTEKLSFVEHHLAHAYSAYMLAERTEALVVTLDGQGDELAGTVFEGRNGQLRRLLDIPETNSLGNFYTNAIAFLGYSLFDEYKVMGLAPYGDPARYRSLFSELYTLHEQGRFTIHWDRLPLLASTGFPRRSGEQFTQEHKDLAAAIQETLEKIVFHFLSHYRQATGLARLCLSGGVAHNCTLTGKLMRSGIFEEVLVQPASNDAGCALGAALAYQHSANADEIEPLSHVFLGTSLGTDEAIASELATWDVLLDFHRMDDTPRQVAGLLAEGAVVGWVQGRSEYGPRALGNRSILADPRPAANRDRVNQMIKKREAYRPFAPAVVAERAHEFFALAKGIESPFMLFSVPVLEPMRAQLGAITHVDGTARLQTVARTDNPRFHALLSAFGSITGFPILLNTSFNNDVEPIVDSLHDAVLCFLTTGLTHLVVGDWLVQRKSYDFKTLMLVPELPPHLSLCRDRRLSHDGWRVFHSIHNHVNNRSIEISEPLYDLLMRSNGECTFHELQIGTTDTNEVLREVVTLWDRRVLRLRPPPSV